MIANSYAGKANYASRGYAAHKIAVIPNGFDTARFAPDPDARRIQRRAWGVGEGTFLVGIVARLDPMKDHDAFVVAAGLLARRNPAVRFAIVGPGAGSEVKRLRQLAERESCADRIIWAGPATDIVAVYNALDLCVSTSLFGEGFSNVLGEAMSCGTPCIATDAGDSAVVINDPSRIVPRGRPDLFAAAWEWFLSKPAEERAAIGRVDRQRVVDTFSIGLAAERLQAHLECIAARTVIRPTLPVSDLSGQ
jgi:glycosyltransferase involved in cell wall biosynthesis